jgi:L-alanine-DL-glutamate epimerase-like enolase superfamily enzyme
VEFHQFNSGFRNKQKQVFMIENGELELPQGPGLGLDIDEEALQRYRVA